MRIHVVVVSALLVTAGPRIADACSIAVNGTHVVDDDLAATDLAAPVIDGEAVATVSDPLGRSGCAGDTCGDLRTLTIDVAVTDNSSTDYEIGFLIELESGDVPITIPTQAASPGNSFEGQAQLVFVWLGEGGSSGVLKLTPIDLAGNLGQPVFVTVEAESEGGCSAAFVGVGGRGAELTLLFFAALLGFRRRRCAR